MSNGRTTSAKAENAKTKTPEKASLRYQSGFGNEFASEAVEAVLPRGQNSPQKRGAWVVRGATERHGIHSAARVKSTDLALPDASFGGAQAVPTHQPGTTAQRTVR